MSALIAAAVVVGAGASIYAAQSASSSAAAANATNAANVTNTNQLNYNEFLQSRGSDGSAIYPLYAQPAEAALYNNAFSQYTAAQGQTLSPAQYQAVANEVAPGQAGAVAAANNIYNGQDLNSDLNSQAGVYGSQLEAAAVNKSATLQSLNQTLNNIKSIQAGKGFSGDSFASQMLGFNARAAANTAAAQGFAQAGVNNATALQQINTNNTNRQITNTALPGSVAGGTENLVNLGTNTANNQTVNNQNLLSNFKIGTQAFTYQNLPLVNPVASTGQIVGQGVAGLASAAGNYATNQQLISALNGGGASGGGTGVSAAQQAAMQSQGGYSNGAFNAGTSGALPADQNLGNITSESAGISSIIG